MGLWDFIELMETNCYSSSDKEVYFLYLDELRMRKIESISEGGNYKLKSLAHELVQHFQKEIQKDSQFVSDSEIENFNFIVKEITD